MKNRILHIFKTILLYYQIHDENPFKIKSYVQVIHSLEKYKDDITKNTDLSRINGVGQSFREKIKKILDTNTLEFYEEIERNNNFKNQVKIYNLSGIGPKKMQEIKNKDIKTIHQLQNKIDKNEIKVSNMTKLHLQYYKNLEHKISRKEMEKVQKYLVTLLKLKKDDVIIAGSYRLGAKESKDIDFIIKKKHLDTKMLLELFNNKGILRGVLMKGNDKMNILIQIPKHRVIHIDLRLVHENDLYFYLLYFGSGVNFSRYIRQVAKDKGYKLDQYGIYKKGKKIDFHPNNEENIFKFLDLEYVVPSNR